VIHPIESFADIDGSHCSFCRWFRVIEAVLNPGGDRKESRGARTERNGTMLSGGRRKRSGKKRKHKSFKNFDSCEKKRYGAVRGAKVRGFAWFEDQNNIRDLPDKAEVSLIKRVVIEGSEIGDALRSQVLEVESCEAIRAHSRRAAGRVDSVCEGGKLMVYLIFFL
jgi:hypothetical protein